jgi:autotransporter strand-loop-strand O-heptosyltransferase
MKTLFPKYFHGKRILDIGSLDVNGNNRFLFDNLDGYIGLDVGEGPNVDVSIPGHKYDAPNEFFDVIISTEVFEHDLYYKDTVQNAIRMLKPGGAFIFTCASGQRPEHGTRRCGEHNAPLLIQQSEEWADYYLNLEESDFLEIPGFKEAFPDGIFELGCYGEFNNEWNELYMHNIHADIYFFGVKGGIKNDLKYSVDHRNPIINPGEYLDHIFVVDAWPNTLEKESDLIETLQRLREFNEIPILLVSHYPIKPELQKLIDYYIYDKENPLLLNSEFNEYGVASGRWTKTDDYSITNEMEYHHDYAIWTSMAHAFNFCKYLGKKVIHFMEYDNLIDTFQYRQSFLEKSEDHDAVIYEYISGSAKDSHFSAYCATYIFSIKTDIAINVINQIKTKRDYFTNRPNGWQLERVFLACLQKTTSNIHMTEYIANSNELNTQAVWNRDGILRDDAKFQIYLGADNFNQLYVHLISGFHESPADKDYLIEIRYAETTRFETLMNGQYLLICLGQYQIGQTVEVRYLGKTVFSEFLYSTIEKFRKMNFVQVKDEDSSQVDLSYNFIDGAYVELKTNLSIKYTANFINNLTGQLIYSVNLANGHWAKTSAKYMIDWRIELTDPSGRIVKTVNFEPLGKKVLISIESNSLGDTLAWFPYVEEFRKKNSCRVVCSTFWNELFRDTYPEIEFLNPGDTVFDLYAVYRIGWYYDGDQPELNRNPIDFRLGPLQKTASDILGLDYYEIKSIINFPKRKLTKKVGLGIHSTAQAKYWNNPIGWQQVTDWLIQNGYEPIILSREDSGFMGNLHPTGATKLPAGPIKSVINELTECQAFVGISSGLTWVAWATNTPTIQVSGLTYEFNEPNAGIIKLTPPAGACSGCMNRIRLDQGDWEWCPEHKGTGRQFECSKLITADRVINELKKILV